MTRICGDVCQQSLGEAVVERADPSERDDYGGVDSASDGLGASGGAHARMFMPWARTSGSISSSVADSLSTSTPASRQ